MNMMFRILAFLYLFLLSVPALADGFADWWLTPDQQGRWHFERGNYQDAARLFERPDWKALSFYKAGDFANAAQLFEKDESAQGLFYLGNALAKQEKLASAVQAYNQALELQPDFPEARFNLDWVKGLLDLDEKEYEDVGGTGGKLGADRMVVSKQGNQAKSEVTTRELQAEKGLSDQEVRDMWMRRVQTTPGDFLAYKFSYQLSNQEQGAEAKSQ